MLYKDFIQNIINERGQWNIEKEKYYEKHHIIPKCFGGGGDHKNGQFSKNSHHSNCIYLYSREHFIAHKLLAEENKNNYKIVLGWTMMVGVTKKVQRDFEITPEEYEELRQFTAHATSLMPRKKNRVPWNKGKVGIYSKETLEKISASSKGRKANLGHHHSTATKQMLSKKRLGHNEGGKASAISRKGKHYYTNGKIIKMFIDGKQPNGWVKSNASKAEGKKWYNNGIKNIFIPKDQKAPEGFMEGMLWQKRMK